MKAAKSYNEMYNLYKFYKRRYFARYFCGFFLHTIGYDIFFTIGKFNSQFCSAFHR